MALVIKRHSEHRPSPGARRGADPPRRADVMLRETKAEAALRPVTAGAASDGNQAYHQRVEISASSATSAIKPPTRASKSIGDKLD